MAGMVTATCLLLGFVWLLLSARWASLPEQAAFTMARRARPSYFAAGCNADFYSLRTDTEACSFGSDAPEDPRVVLLGDSHAAQWYPAVERLSTERSWRLWPMTKSSCAPLPVLQFNPRLGREYRECATWLENALSSIEEIEPDLVLVTWSMRHALSRRQWTEGVEGLIARLAPAGDHIAVLEDTPWPAFDIPKCLARRTWRPNLVGGDSCQFEPVQGNRERAFDGVRAVAARVRNVSMIDMNGVICPATPCPPDRHGEPIYRDTHHLAPGFVVDLAEALARELDQTRSLPKIGTGATTSQ